MVNLRPSARAELQLLYELGPFLFELVGGKDAPPPQLVELDEPVGGRRLVRPGAAHRRGAGGRGTGVDRRCVGRRRAAVPMQYRELLGDEALERLGRGTWSKTSTPVSPPTSTTTSP